MAEKLMRKSGAWAQLADVPAQVRSGITQAPIRSQLPPADLARLERSADAAFSTDRLRSIALSVLVTELSAHHAVEAMAWYSSPTGLMITALEEAASHEFTNLNAALRHGNAALAAATPERQTLIIRLVRATQSYEELHAHLNRRPQRPRGPWASRSGPSGRAPNCWAAVPSRS
jgi:hypothetical protein